MPLPASAAALLFDVDGVLTDTAVVHSRAWKETFDEVLERCGESPPFDEDDDYARYVDGRSRLDGVRAFLDSRNIELPEGEVGDPPDALTVQGVGRRKNDLLVRAMRTDGVRAFPDAVDFVRRAHDRGLLLAVVSSSANAREALRSAGIEACFDTWVDGVRIDADDLTGKPAPDTFLAAAADLDVDPADAVVFEDALAGVEAGRAGGFGCVVGVDRHGDAEALRERGADIVVSDLGTLELPR